MEISAYDFLPGKNYTVEGGRPARRGNLTERDEGGARKQRAFAQKAVYAAHAYLAGDAGSILHPFLRG